MKLFQQQCKFTRDLARLIDYINKSGYHCKMLEVQRTLAQAELYSKQGKGSKNSLHIKCLAADIAIFKDDVYLTDTEDYRFAGAYWEGLDAQNIWGGNFTQRKDGNHFERSENKKEE